ncbi:DUF6879 family protein [Streptomyces sp. NPDC059866]|uniref:DUF6879 family protein n=1 Tax=Streptomyces sp. NPDC059866 TaxID=3346978 RepID=UPI00366881EF
MTLRFIGTTSEHGNCPTLYEVVETGDTRVRIIDEPPTDGQRFLMATATGNVDTGEDIQILRRSEAERLGLPNRAFWLFDSRTLVRMHIDDTDTTIGVELVEDPAEVLAACQARDAALRAAVPTAEVWAQVRSSV